jgi:hypothetical protein
MLLVFRFKIPFQQSMSIFKFRLNILNLIDETEQNEMKTGKKIEEKNYLPFKKFLVDKSKVF